MPKLQNLSKRPEKALSAFSIRRHLARLFIARHDPLVKKNNPPKQNNTPCSVDHEEAYHKIHLESGGRLVLTEGGYYGDHKRHFLFCHDCRNHIVASYWELKMGLPLCPHCEGDQFLERFANVREMQEYCLDFSLHTAYYLGTNRVGGTMNEPRNFYCTIHKIIYETTMEQFFTDSHGCPVCGNEIESSERS